MPELTHLYPVDKPYVNFIRWCQGNCFPFTLHERKQMEHISLKIF